MKVSDYISSDIQSFIRAAIAEANGNEVFIIGKTGAERIVQSAEVLARGNEVEVPAIIRNCRPGDAVIHNHPSGLLKPSSADNRIASLLGNDGVGFYIVNNDVSEIYVGIEPACHEEPGKIDLPGVSALIEPGGAIAKALPGFEAREPQVQMLADVAQAFNEEKITAIEAGTGTGKTLAYLLPAIQWSLMNKKRVVISTNTINLQQQLTEKDIPLIQRAIPQKFDAALIKGRTNYLCLRKLYEALKQPSLLDIGSGAQELEGLAAWAAKTTDGSKADLGALPGERVWEHIQSESDTTLKNKCPYYGKCFFYRARRRAASADILVANHHLVFADLSVRRAAGEAAEISVLPKYDRIIFDEAHNLEDVASRYFGVSVSYLGILRTLNRLWRTRDDKDTGLLPFIRARLAANERLIPPQVAETASACIDDAKQNLERARLQFSATMERLFNWVVNQQKSAFSDAKLRLTREIVQHETWRDLVRELPEGLKLLQNIATCVESLVKALARISTSFESEARSLSVDVKAQAERLVVVSAELSTVLLEWDEHDVRWIEAKESRYGPILRFYTAPVDVSEILVRSVFERFPTVIMTSATLAVGKSFDYLAGRIGLDKIEAARKMERILDSPFDYSTQVMIGIPTDIPAPNDPAYEKELPALLQQGVLASGGRAFVLFTAYGLLNRMYRELEKPMRTAGISLYRQGQENRHNLLNRFRSDVTSVLLATDSFWEGVDVPGAALVQVIIPRLPFRVPSEPVIEARVEAIENAGGNSFLEYAVPQAALKFKQGFGRLIRNRTDFGAILILDKRVVSKFYGRVFLETMPECRVVVGAADEVFNNIREFMDSKL